MNRKSYLFECEVNELLANPKKGVQRIYYHTIEGNEIEEGGSFLPWDGAPPTGESPQHFSQRPQCEDFLTSQVTFTGNAPNTKPLLR